MTYFRLETKISGRRSSCVTPARRLPHAQQRSSSHTRHLLHVEAELFQCADEGGVGNEKSQPYRTGPIAHPRQ